MINLLDYPIFANNMSTLKDTSIDKRDSGDPVFMTQTTIPAVNFDKVKEEYVLGLGLNEVPKSNDALFDNNGTIVFVEFKNGYLDRSKQYSIRKKIYDSILIYSDITSIKISEMRTDTDYILVYNEAENLSNPDPQLAEKRSHVQASPAFDTFAKTLSKLSNEEYVCFDLKKFQTYCFKSVHTYTEKEFEKYLVDTFDLHSDSH